MAYDAPRFIFLLIFLLFFVLSPDSKTPSLSHLLEVEERVAHEAKALHILNSSEYGNFDTSQDRWLHLTGLRKEDAYSWQALPEVQARARLRFDRAVLTTGLDGGNQSALRTVPDGQEILDDDGLARGIDPYRGELPMYHNVTTGVLHGHWARWGGRRSS